MKSMQNKLLEVLNKDKKRLYKTFKINWQMKDKIHLKFGEGSFTVNKLIKNYGMDTNNLNLILFTTSYDILKSRDVSIVQYDGTDVNISFGTPTRMRIFSTKADFNEERKNCSYFLLISIEKDAINSDKKEKYIKDFIQNEEIKNLRFTPNHKRLINIYDNFSSSLSLNGKDIFYDKYLCHSDTRYIKAYLDKSGYYKTYFTDVIYKKLTERKHSKVYAYIQNNLSCDLYKLHYKFQIILKQYAEALNTVCSSEEKFEKLLDNSFLIKNISLRLWELNTKAVTTLDTTKATLNTTEDYKYSKFESIQEYLMSVNKVTSTLNEAENFISGFLKDKITSI